MITDSTYELMGIGEQASLTNVDDPLGMKDSRGGLQATADFVVGLALLL